MSRNLRVWLSDDVLAQITGTGIVNGGIISINVDNTKFDLSAGFGYIINNYTDPYTPTVNYVIWNSFSAVVDSYLTSDGVTNIAIDINGNIIQQAAEFTLEQSRDLIILGKTIHASRTIITNVSTNTRFINNLPDDSYDLARSLGVINISGNIYGPDGANLQLDKSEGRLHRVGINYGASRKDPNTYDVSSQVALSFRYRYRDITPGYFLDTALLTNIDPNNYDNGGGVLTPVPANKFTIQRIYLFKDFTVITYGQALYDTLQGAVDGISAEMPVLDSNLEDAALRCYLVLKQGVTSLQDAGNVYFSPSSKLGESLISIGASGYSGMGYSGYSGIMGYSGYSGISGYSGYGGISGYSGYNGLVGSSGYSGISGYSGAGYSGYSGFGYSGYSGVGYSGYSGFGYSGYSGKSGYSGLGYSGYSGIPGNSGYSGISGNSGYSGISGYSGRSGTSGVSGYSGYLGKSGYSGYYGISGYSGYSGMLGVSGYSGYYGQSGYSGSSGTSGYNGEDGEDGSSGYSGASGFVPGGSGYSGLSGYSGYSGIDGSSGYSGVSGQSGAVPGGSGYSGLSGYSGISGQSGYSGISGQSGYSGIGTSGYSGVGTSGYSGLGSSGYSGASGFVPGGSGYSGLSGLNGTSGSSGYSGASGFVPGGSGYSGRQGTSGYSGGGGGSNTEVRLIVNGDSTVQLLCAGPTSDLNNVILSKAISPLAPSVTITNPSINVKYISLKAFWSASDWGSYTSTTITFPETTGQTTLDAMQRPLALRYTSSSYANGSPNSTVTNISGTVTVSMAGFTGGQYNALQLIW